MKHLGIKEQDEFVNLFFHEISDAQVFSKLAVQTFFLLKVF